MIPTIMLYIAGTPIFHRINRYKNKYHQNYINNALYEMVKIGQVCLSHCGWHLVGNAAIVNAHSSSALTLFGVKNGRLILNIVAVSGQ